MKNEKIIDAWDKMKPSDEIKNQIFGEITQKHRQRRGKRRIFKPSKIIASAAVILLAVGLINIQTVIGMINGLFFAPGVGMTSNPVIYYGINGPIDIETEYGLLTLKFANRITIDGRTHLWLFIQPSDIRRGSEQEDNPLYISINAGGEYVVSNEELMVYSNVRSNGSNFVSYQYFHEDFPNVNGFFLTVRGVETYIPLTHQPGNFALSEEINGITVAANKFALVTDLIAIGVFDSSESAEDYMISGFIPGLRRAYREDGGRILSSGAQGRFSRLDPLNYYIIEFFRNEKEIKSIPIDEVSLMYMRKESLPVEIPVPRDGESIQVNIEIPIGAHIFKITEVRREGDIIYYENNALHATTEKGTEFVGGQIPYMNPEREQAVANRESFIKEVFFSLFANSEEVMENIEAIRQGILPQMSGGEIWNFDENAESLTFYFNGAAITQFGDFNITFD